MTVPACRPLIILCPGRSFSSVLCTAIGQHPELCDLPEIYLGIADSVGELLDRASERGKRYLAYGLVRVIAELYQGDQSEDSAQAAWAWLRQRRDWSTGRLFHALAERVAPRQLVDKSPTHGQPDNLQRLRAIFPQARFLHLLRHPRGNCASLYKVHAQRASSAGSQDALLLAEQVERQWLKVHRHILAFTATLPAGQVMRLRGEDALAEPELYFAQLAEWLGIRTDAAAIDAMLHPEDSPYARPGPPSAPYGNNPGFIDDPRLRRGWPATGPLQGPLEWSPLGAGFTAETLALARSLGYR